MTITLEGLNDKKLEQQVQSARKRLDLLRSICLSAKGFDSAPGRSIYTALIRYTYKYCFHIVAVEKASVTQIFSLERSFFSAATGVSKAPLP